MRAAFEWLYSTTGGNDEAHTYHGQKGTCSYYMPSRISLNYVKRKLEAEIGWTEISLQKKNRLDFRLDMYIASEISSENQMKNYLAL